MSTRRHGTEQAAVTKGETKSHEDPIRELESTKRDRHQIVEHAENHRRAAIAFERQATVIVKSAGLDELLTGLLDVFAETAGADVGVVRLREGERLKSRAALGLEEEVASGFSMPAEGVIDHDGEPLPLGPVTSTHALSDVARDKGIRGLYSVLLVHGSDVVGAVFLGTKEERDFTAHDRHLVGALAAVAAAAIVRRGEHEALRQGLRAREEVLGVVAHDLRNPITAIGTTANTLLQRVSDAAVRRPVERVIRAAQRANRLIEDLLEVHAIEAGRFSIDPRPMEVADVILAALDSQQSLTASASVILATDLSPELPAIHADEERLLEVLENLVGNAVKFTGRGGTVTVGACARDGNILIWVKDSGSGIAPEQLPHLYDRFWQATKKDRRGTGLGLTICKAIVEAHGGRIWAESTVGVGTTMFFTIPAALRSEPKIASTEISNILIVDDRDDNLLSLKAILARPDYRLVTAKSGEQALSLALRMQIDVALIDIAMPGMNGLEVAVALKELERSRDIPIIFVTAFGDDPEEIHRAYAAGGADYLVKPLDAEIVRKKVAVFVDLSRRRQVARP